MSEVKDPAQNADRVFPEVTVTFGEPPKDYSLRYTLGSIIKLQQLTGKNPFEPELEKDEAGNPKLDDEGKPIPVQKRVDPSEVAHLVWAGLLHTKLFPTFDDVACEIEMHQLAQVCDAVRKAMQRSVPQEKKADPALPEALPAQ